MQLRYVINDSIMTREEHLLRTAENRFVVERGTLTIYTNHRQARPGTRGPETLTIYRPGLVPGTLTIYRPGLVPETLTIYRPGLVPEDQRH